MIGVLFVLDAACLNILREEKKSKHSITDIVLSRDELKIAVSTFEGTVLICDFNTLQTLATINLKYSRPALSLDFSIDDSKMRISFAPDRLAYFDLHSLVEIREPSTILEVKWRSLTWKYSWETQGRGLPIFRIISV